MAKKIAPSITPLSVMADLISTTKNDELLARLETAESMLDYMSVSQHERCVADELAGTIATIIGRICVEKTQIPVLMVADPDEKKHEARLLREVVELLKELGHLSRDITVSVKEKTSDYLCAKRLHNSITNGHSYPPSLANYLTVGTLSKGDAAKLCVTTCSNSCRFASSCKYKSEMESLKSGAAQIQVYDLRQYKSALNAGNLPKSRMTVYSPTGRKILAEDGVRVVTEKELLKLLLICERSCGSIKTKKRKVYAQTDAIRCLCNELFSMSTSGVEEQRAKELLLKITDKLDNVRKDCFKELCKEKNTEWNKMLNGVLKRLRGFKETAVLVEHRNGGRKSLVAA